MYLFKLHLLSFPSVHITVLSNEGLSVLRKCGSLLDMFLCFINFGCFFGWEIEAMEKEKGKDSCIRNTWSN